MILLYKKNPSLDVEFLYLLIHVENLKGLIGIGVESNKDFKLFFGGGFVLGDHEFRQLIGGAETIRAVEAMGESIVGSKSVVEAFLFGGPMEELGGDIRVRLGFEYFGDEVRSDAAEFVEIGDDGWAPVVLVFEE